MGDRWEEEGQWQGWRGWSEKYLGGKIKSWSVLIC